MKKILLIILFMVVSLLGEHPKNTSDDESKNLIQISNNLTQVIQESFSKAKAAVVTNELLLKQNNYNVSKFDLWAEELINEFSDVSNIQLAPNGVVKHIYPLEGNEKAIGHDLLKDPKRKIAAIEAIKSGKITLIGPIKLIQNNEYALIVRKPVDKDNEFWGYSTALVSVKNILKDIRKVIDETNYNFTIYGNNPDDKNPTVFYSSKIEPSVDANLFELIVPNGKWYLKIEAKNHFQNNYLNLTKEELEYIKNKKEIIVSNDVEYKPYDFIDKDGNATGFSKDYLDAILKDTGLKVKYVSKIWSELLDDMENRKIDVLKSVLKNENREKKYLYSNEYLNSSDAFVTTIDVKRINDIKELEGKTIALIKDWALEDFIDNYPKIKKVYLNTIDEVLDYIEEGKADFTILDKFIAYYYISSHGHINIKVNSVLSNEKFKSDYYFATQKDDKILNSILNKAMNKFSINDKSKLLNKWFSIDKLYELKLTSNEKEYLKDKPEIKLGFPTVFEPLVFINQLHQVDGYFVDVYKELEKKYNIKFTFDIDTWDNTLEKLQKNKIDIIPGMGKKIAVEKGFLSARPIVESKIIVYANKSFNKEINTLEDLKGLKVGFNLNNKFLYKNLNSNNNILRLRTFNSDLDAFYELEYGELDAVVGLFESRSNIVRQGLTNTKPVGVIKNLDFSTVTAISPENKLLQSIIQKMLSSLTFEEKSKINTKWFGNINTFGNNFEGLNLTLEEKEYLQNNKTIKFPTYNDWLPFNFLEKNEPKGFVVDLTKKIANKLGLEIEFIKNKSWPQHMEMLKNDEVDLIGNMVYNDQRAKTYNFSDKSTLELYTGIISKGNFTKIEQLKNKVLGIQKDSIFDSFIKKYYPSQQVKYYEDTNSMLKALVNNHIDAFAENYTVAKYLINNSFKFNDIKINIIEDKNSTNIFMYYATNKNNPILTSLINKAYNSISIQEINELKTKWVLDLDKYSLTRLEKEFLDKNKTINVCTRYNHMPLSGEKDGKILGISGEIFNKISEKLKVDFKAVGAYSDKEFRDNIISNKCQLVTTISQDYRGFENISTTKMSIVNQKFVAIGNINHFYIEELEDKREFTFYVLKEIHKNKILEILPNLNVVQINTEKEIFEKIQKDDNAFYVTLSILGDYAIQKYGLDKFKVIDTIEDLSGKGAIGVNMVISPEFLSIIDKTLQSIGSEALNDIAFEYKLKEFRIINSYAWLWYLVALLVAVIITVLGRYLFILKETNKEESIYREILDNSVSRVAYVNNNYKYKKVNSKYAQMIGKDKKDIENHYMIDVLGEEYFNKNLRENIDSALLGNNVEFEVAFKDRIISANYSPYFDKETNQILGVIFDLVDITEKREAELAEKELASRLKKAQEIGRLGAWKYLLKDNTFTLTGVVAKLHDVETLKAVSPEICFRKGHEEDIPKMAAALEGTLKDINFKKELIYRIYDENNEIRYMEVKWEHIFDEGGNIIGLDGVGQDITEKMLSKIEIESQQAMLTHSQRLAQQGEMLQMIGHQWRQPLSQISINAQIIEAFVENPSDIVKEKVQLIVDVTQYLSKTISDFKHFFTDKKQVLEFKLDEVFDDSLSVINHRITQQSINIHRNFIGLEEEIKGYKTELGQVILAIVNNAIDVLEEKDQSRDINIEAFKDNDEVVIKIQDNAGGIPDDIINKIFDPYFSTKLEKNGTGLGLYMCKMIVEKSFEGTIEVKNQNDGACFTIKFPPL